MYDIVNHSQASSSTAQKQDAIPAEILHLAQHELPSNKLIYGMDALLEEMSPPYVETNDEIPSGNQQEMKMTGLLQGQEMAWPSSFEAMRWKSARCN